VSETSTEEVTGPQPLEVPLPTQGALGRNSVARLLADLAGLACGAGVAVITARWLGPAGKGVAATLGYLAAVLGRCAPLGLGDSAIVLVGKGAVRMRHAFKVNLAAVGVAGAALVLPFLAAAVALIDPDTTELWLALLAASATIPLSAMQDILSHALIMREHIIQSSAVVAVTAATTLVCSIVFVVVLSLDVLGAMAAVAAGIAVGLLLAAIKIPTDLRTVPGWDRAYLREAIPFGLRFEVSNLVTFLAGRIDLLLVFVLAGEAAAGNYSVALTIGSVVALGPFALSYASFPRLAYSHRSDAQELAARSCRAGLMFSLVLAVLLAAASPLLIPALFGDDFAPAIAPTILLVGGAIAAGGQWVLARAAAAQGDPGLVVRSFGLSLAVMIALDFALIPGLEIVGAAIASVVSSVVGFGICAQHYRRDAVAFGALLPRWTDVAELSREIRLVLAQIAARVS
jgi:O-antigen/teichoic acid export membrane protein